MKYEYTVIKVDIWDLEELNRLSQDGWRVVQSIDSTERYFDPKERGPIVEIPCKMFLLERPTP